MQGRSFSMSLVRENPVFGSAIDQADELFRQGFAALIEAGIMAAGNPHPDELNSRIAPLLARSNPCAIRDAAKAKGWISPPYAVELFRELELPNGTALAIAYENLKEAIGGKSEKWYRDKARR
jgi:hypothetical protein